MWREALKCRAVRIARQRATVSVNIGNDPVLSIFFMLRLLQYIIVTGSATTGKNALTEASCDWFATAVDILGACR